MHCHNIYSRARIVRHTRTHICTPVVFCRIYDLSVRFIFAGRPACGRIRPPCSHRTQTKESCTRHGSLKKTSDFRRCFHAVPDKVFETAAVTSHFEFSFFSSPKQISVQHLNSFLQKGSAISNTVPPAGLRKREYRIRRTSSITNRYSGPGDSTMQTA